MCGITGAFNVNGTPADIDIVTRMTRALAHRGPDDENVYVHDRGGVGHRRLAIIDLSPAASQPMHNTSGTITLVYNGEIYNFRELRKELETAGHIFRSHSDTEVVLRSYEEWGPQCVKRFNGMFAFAAWDHARHSLLLARDRYGIKPLYFSLTAEALLFASEIKSLMQHPSFSVAVDSSVLLEYFTFQNVFSDGTLFEGVTMLPAGHLASIDLRKIETPRPECYWDFEFRSPGTVIDFREHEEELDRLFLQAVERQLVSDVPVGTYLSGGIDSGAITAVASRHIPHLTTFTCGFDLSSASGLELGFDERERAEALSFRFRTEQYEVVAKSGDMERVMPSLVWHLEDLRIGQCYPNFYVSQLASKFVKVVLAGTGGDELFGGYPWRYYGPSSCSDFDAYTESYYKYWQRLVPNRTIHRLFQPHVWGEVEGIRTVDIFRSVLARGGSRCATREDFVNHSLYFEVKTFLHGLLLVEDKLSMAHGLETRVPFLDNDLVDFAMRLPVSTKLRHLASPFRIDENEVGPKKKIYADRTNDGKLILRSVLSRYVPGDYANAPKKGFSGPDASWFRGESLDYVRRLILGGNARLFDYLRRDTVSELVQEHLQGVQNHRLLIWSLLSFEWWLRQFADGGRGTPTA